jgi:tetratricopeptide (TPR) repeat protein
MTDLHDSMRAALRSLAHEEFEAGRTHLVALVDDAPDWAEAWALLGGANLALSDIEAATDASERALALAPERFLPCLKAGELSMRLGDLERAEALFLAALRDTEPDSADAAAAKRALVLVRTAQPAGIAHRARLPAAPRLRRLLPRPLRGSWSLAPSPADADQGVT